MIYYCADDYGLCAESSKHIEACVNKGALNKVSVFLNFDEVDFSKIQNHNLRISLHLNLVEGKCLADPREVPLIADENGNLKHTFEGLFKLNLFHRNEFEEQVYKEIKAQVQRWNQILPQGVPFCIDTHQHTSMIPAVFKSLLRVLQEENITPEHVRIPVEPLRPFITTPSLFHTYSAINVVKQWLLNFLWLINKNEAKNQKVQTSYFFGILFSGKMDEKRVSKILPKYVKLAEKDGKDIEILFHPGYLTEKDPEFTPKNVAFETFYLSENRKTEFDSVMKFAKGSDQ